MIRRSWRVAAALDVGLRLRIQIAPPALRVRDATDKPLAVNLPKRQAGMTSPVELPLLNRPIASVAGSHPLSRLR